MAKWYDYNKLLINLFPTSYNKVKYIDLSKLVNYSIWIGKILPDNYLVRLKILATMSNWLG